MREGGVGAQFFGLVSLPVADRIRGLARAVHEQIDALDDAVARRPGNLRLARTAADIEACERDGAIAALLGIEGAHALEGDLDRVEDVRAARRALPRPAALHRERGGLPAYGRGRQDVEA